MYNPPAILNEGIGLVKPHCLFLNQIGQYDGHRSRDPSHAMHQHLHYWFTYIGPLKINLHKLHASLEIPRQIKGLMILARDILVEGQV
jgi:hypothetical protein